MFLTYGKGVCHLCHERGSPGAERAEKLYTILTGSKELSQKAKEALETGGLTEGEVEFLKGDILNADTAITEAVIVSHALDLGKISGYLTKADKLSQDVIDKVKEKKESTIIKAPSSEREQLS